MLCDQSSPVAVYLELNTKGPTWVTRGGLFYKNAGGYGRIWRGGKSNSSEPEGQLPMFAVLSVSIVVEW